MVMVMDEEELPDDLKAALADRLEGWELVEMLEIPIEDIIELFEPDILDHLDDILEELNMEPIEYDDGD